MPHNGHIRDEIVLNLALQQEVAVFLLLKRVDQLVGWDPGFDTRGKSLDFIENFLSFRSLLAVLHRSILVFHVRMSQKVFAGLKNRLVE